MSNQKKIDLFQVVVNPGSVVLRVPAGAILLEALQAEGIAVSSSCGGNGTCGTCRVVVQAPSADHLTPRNEIETEMQMDRGLEENERLSCQCEVTQNLKILIPNVPMVP